MSRQPPWVPDNALAADLRGIVVRGEVPIGWCPIRRLLMFRFFDCRLGLKPNKILCPVHDSLPIVVMSMKDDERSSVRQRASSCGCLEGSAVHHHETKIHLQRESIAVELTRLSPRRAAEFTGLDLRISTARSGKQSLAIAFTPWQLSPTSLALPAPAHSTATISKHVQKASKPLLAPSSSIPNYVEVARATADLPPEHLTPLPSPRRVEMPDATRSGSWITKDNLFVAAENLPPWRASFITTPVRTPVPQQL